MMVGRKQKTHRVQFMIQGFKSEVHKSHNGYQLHMPVSSFAKPLYALRLSRPSFWCCSVSSCCCFVRSVRVWHVLSGVVAFLLFRYEWMPLFSTRWTLNTATKQWLFGTARAISAFTQQLTKLLRNVTHHSGCVLRVCVIVISLRLVSVKFWPVGKRSLMQRGGSAFTPFQDSPSAYIGVIVCQHSRARTRVYFLQHLHTRR